MQFDILVGNFYGYEGDLIEDFKALSKVYIFNDKRKPHSKFIYYFYKTPLVKEVVSSLKRKFLRRKIEQGNYSLIYSNTMATWDALKFLAFLQCPVITHVHEMEYILGNFSEDKVKVVKGFTDHYIAVSRAVKQNLIRNHTLPEREISLVYEFIDVPKLSSEALQALNKSTREVLGIPEGAFVVGGSGDTVWRKGPDLFIQLADAVYRMSEDKDIFFLWVGGDSDGRTYRELMHDVRQLGLNGRVRFLGQKTNPLDYFAAFDVFTMVSREDPFPLVNLEVGSLGKPTLCFDEAGGTKEFVEDDAGFVVPYLDVKAMAKKMIELRGKPDLRLQLGATAKKKVIEKYNVEVVSRKICEVIDCILGSDLTSTRLHKKV